MVVDYSDLDAPSITDEQYRANLLHQYPDLDPSLDTAQLEWIIDYHYVPDDTRLAFVQSTHTLPEDVQRIIFGMSF
jgi:hypothetical protein